MKNRTYRYFTGKPLYPFGYGLSYTAFEVRSAGKQGLRVVADVANTGKRDGETVVQVYVACDHACAPLHPRLCGFRRGFVPAGATARISVPLDPGFDCVIDENGERIQAEHCTLFVGLSQPDELSTAMTGTQPIRIQL